MTNKPKEYICPKCRTKITSVKPLTYCICGGKYRTTFDQLVDEYKNIKFEKIFGGL